MAKKGKKPPGVDLYIPGKDELRPNARDAQPGRGPLAYAQAHHQVMDLGAPPVVDAKDKMYYAGSQVMGVLPGSETTNPASASFTPGWVKPVKPKKADKPEVIMQPGVVIRGR